MKTISILTALMIFGLGAQSAKAGLLGMPMHLKSAAEHLEFNKPVLSGHPSSDFVTDDLPAALLVITC